MHQRKGFDYLKELLPTVQALWQGDTEHRGRFWDFPMATSVPKPVQQPHPPIWIAARDPETFAWAMDIGANIMATPLSRPHAEVSILGRRFAETLAKFPDRPRPRFLMLRRVCVYDRPEDARIPIDTSIKYGLAFDSLFAETAGVVNGFAAPVDVAGARHRPEYQPDMIRDGMIMGTPDEVVAKLRDYEAVGVDQFCYGANFGLPHAFARRSLELFITKVMPHFASTVRAEPLLATV